VKAKAVIAKNSNQRRKLKIGAGENEIAKKNVSNGGVCGMKMVAAANGGKRLTVGVNQPSEKNVTTKNIMKNGGVWRNSRAARV